MVTDKDQQTVNDQLQWVINNTFNWIKYWKIKIRNDKSAYINYTLHNSVYNPIFLDIEYIE